jgi:hypothetical protein
LSKVRLTASTTGTAVVQRESAVPSVQLTPTESEVMVEGITPSPLAGELTVTE